TVSASSPLTLATALVTALPPQASPPSRRSVASNSPVEAPEGTAARPWAPERSWTSTSTVGLPRESRICRACTVSIWLIGRAGYSARRKSRLRVELQLLIGRQRLPRRAGSRRELL